ncbi:hypothetical protein JO40_00165 [Treponema putidum]|nr:hypothetical protein JO40_00165 [Treponema putidum]
MGTAFVSPATVIVIFTGFESRPLPPPCCGEDGTELLPTGFLQPAKNAASVITAVVINNIFFIIFHTSIIYT